VGREERLSCSGVDSKDIGGGEDIGAIMGISLITIIKVQAS
jgi:hypothetical protein